jgi:hypothetical protein
MPGVHELSGIEIPGDSFVPGRSAVPAMVGHQSRSLATM